MVSSFWSIHQKWSSMSQEEEGQRERESCLHLSAVDVSAVAETCLNAAPVAQRTAQAGSIKMTSRWAELYTQGKKCSHRHSDWGHPIQEQMQPGGYSSFFLWGHHYLLKSQVCFINPSFPLESADHLTFKTMRDEQNFSIWKLRMTQSLSVSSTFVASPAELFQETRMLVSWTTQGRLSLSSKLLFMC